MRTASASAWPFAYVSITAERLPAAAAERRPEARAIHTIRPIRTSAASAIHSHSSDEPDPPAAGEAAAAVVGAGAWLVTGSCAVGVGALPVGRRLEAALLAAEATLLTAPLTGPLPPHPAARGPTTRAIAATASPFLSRLIPVLPSPRPSCAPHPLCAAERDPAASLLRRGRGVFTRQGWAGQRGGRSPANRSSSGTAAPVESPARMKLSRPK